MEHIRAKPAAGRASQHAEMFAYPYSCTEEALVQQRQLTLQASAPTFVFCSLAWLALQHRRCFTTARLSKRLVSYSLLESRAGHSSSCYMPAKAVLGHQGNNQICTNMALRLHACISSTKSSATPDLQQGIMQGPTCCQQYIEARSASRLGQGLCRTSTGNIMHWVL